MQRLIEFLNCNVLLYDDIDKQSQKGLTKRAFNRHK